MPILRNVGCLARCPPGGKQAAIDPVADAALAWRDGRILWAGPEEELPPEAVERARAPELDAGGGLVVPGLVDCHTHLAFAGWRADEFVRRLRGESYAGIAASGGGIAATVRATRAATEEELLRRSRGFLEEMAALGVTTVEAKSGYGLALEAELRQLRVYRRLDEEARRGAGGEGTTGVRSLPRVVPTFLGAHAFPPGLADEIARDPAARRRNVDRIVEEWIPAVAEEGLARFCDVFVEEGAFTPEEAERVLEAGRRHGLAPKLHVDQLSDGGGAALAARIRAVSADHLEHVSKDGIEALAGTGTVAVTLPLASLYLGEPPAPARRLVDAGVPVAVATDFNPGTAPSAHLPLALTLACLRGGLTPAEALAGATSVAARAVGRAEEIGSLLPGRRADFALLDAPDVDHWLYRFRANACRLTVAGGRPIRDPEGLFPASGARGSAPGPSPRSTRESFPGSPPGGSGEPPDPGRG